MKQCFHLIKALIIFALAFSLQGCLLLDALLEDSHSSHKRKRNTSISKAIETGDAGRVVSSSRSYSPPPPIYLSSPIRYSESSPEVKHDPVTKETNDKDEMPHELANDTNSTNYPTEKIKVNEPELPLAGIFSIHNQVSGDDFLEDTVNYSLFFGGSGEGKVAFGVRFSFANMAFRDDWIYANKLKSPWSMDIGFEGKLYLSENKHFLQPYVGAYLAYGGLFWAYRTPLIDSATGDEIKKDHVDYLKVGAMAGLRLRVTKYIRVAAEIRPEMMYTGTTTNQGFFNDAIDNNSGTYAGISIIYIDYD